MGRNIYVVFFLIVLPILAFLYGRQTLSVEQNAAVESDNAVLTSDVQQRKPVEKSANVFFVADSPSPDYTDDDAVEYYLDYCGLASSDNLLLVYDDYIDSFTDAQQQLYNDINARCEDWYVYVEKYGSDIFAAKKAALKEQNNREIDFMFSTDIDDSVQLAKEVVKGDNDTVSYHSAVNYLISLDHDLKTMAAEAIGTKNTYYVGVSINDQVVLYWCDTYPQDCSPTGRYMVAMCLSHSEYCDMDYHQYLRATRSPNELADIYQVVQFYRELFLSGYPD